jgi:hypothetical protein
MKSANIGPFKVGLADSSGVFTVYRGCSVVAAGLFKGDELREYRQTGRNDCPSKGAVIGAIRSILAGDTAPAVPSTPIEAVESSPPMQSYDVDLSEGDGEEIESARKELRALAGRRRAKKASE